MHEGRSNWVATSYKSDKWENKKERMKQTSLIKWTGLSNTETET